MIATSESGITAPNSKVLTWALHGSLGGGWVEDGLAVSGKLGKGMRTLGLRFQSARS